MALQRGFEKTYEDLLKPPICYTRSVSDSTAPLLKGIMNNQKAHDNLATVMGEYLLCLENATNYEPMVYVRAINRLISELNTSLNASP